MAKLRPLLRNEVAYSGILPFEPNSDPHKKDRVLE